MRGYSKHAPVEKVAIMRTFLKLRKGEGSSIRNYAVEMSIPYYTMRNMYWDLRYNTKWKAPL